MIEVSSEMVEAGAQALANDRWSPPIRLGMMARYEADKLRREARIVLEAALSSAYREEPK